MFVDKNPTKRQHYVPQMYLKNFRAKETDLSVRMKENMLSCYLIHKEKCFNTVESKICQEKNLYEFDTQNSLNYIEERFKENVEDLIAPLIKETIDKCKISQNGDLILLKEDIELYGKYIIIQLLRLPQMINIFYPELLRKVKERNIDVEDEKVVRGALLYTMSDLNSSQLDEIFKKCIESHTFIVLKNNDFSFFTTDRAILFNYIGSINQANCTCDDFIVYSDLLLPLSPQHCLMALNNIEDQDYLPNGSFIECKDINIEHLLMLIPWDAKIIISDKITDSMIDFIQSYFTKNLQKWETEKEQILSSFEKIYGYRPIL